VVVSSATVDGEYTVEPDAVFFFGSGRFEVPISGNMRFYQVQDRNAVRLENPRIFQGRMTFEVRAP